MSKFIKELGCTENTLAEILQEPLGLSYNAPALYYDKDWYLSFTQKDDKYNCYEIKLEQYLEMFDECDSNIDLDFDIEIVLQTLKKGYIHTDGVYAEATSLFYDNGEYYIHTYWDEHIVRVKDFGKVWW